MLMLNMLDMNPSVGQMLLTPSVGQTAADSQMVFVRLLTSELLLSRQICFVVSLPVMQSCTRVGD